MGLENIGIRKAIGGSRIAIPAAIWAVSKWLNKYEYHTTISGLVLILTSFAVIAIALLTISFQTIKAALANPVKSLRSE